MEQYGISRNALCGILHLSGRNFLRRKEQRRLAPNESDLAEDLLFDGLRDEFALSEEIVARLAAAVARTD
jgi:hypothetical protein